MKKEVKKEKTPAPAGAATTPPNTEVKKDVKTEKETKEANAKIKEAKNAESELVRDLKAQIKYVQY